MKYKIEKVLLADLKTEFVKAAGALNADRIEGLKEIHEKIGTLGLPIVNRRTMQVLAEFHDLQITSINGNETIDVIMVDIPEDNEIDFFAKLTDPPLDGEPLYQREKLLGNYYREGEGKRLRLESRKPKDKPEDYYAPYMGYSRPQIQKLAQIGLKAPDLLKEINVTETINSAFFLMEKRLQRKQAAEARGDEAGEEAIDKFFISDPELIARVMGILEKLLGELGGDTKLNRWSEKGRDREGVDYAMEDEHGFGYLKYFPKPEEIDPELQPKSKTKKPKS